MMNHTNRTILQNIEPLISFSFVILVEPMLSPNGAAPLTELRKALIRSACERRDVWPNKPYALRDLTTKARKSPWDRRALALYVEHGLIPHKGAKWDPPYTGIVLACSRDEEAVRGGHELILENFTDIYRNQAMYRDVQWVSITHFKLSHKSA